MHLSKTLVSCISTILLMRISFAQNVRSVKSSNTDSCNVVNVYVGNKDDQTDTPEGKVPGSQGKRGPAGPVGSRGEKGERGLKGDQPSPNDLRTLTNEVLLALTVSSCSELQSSHGISTTGYYWMKNDFPSDSGSLTYCDFRVYTGVSTCAELTAKHNVSTYGYYRLGSAGNGYQYCPDVYTCHQLVQRDHISESGFYQVGLPGHEYTVYCNLFTSTATTEIWHGSLHEIKVSSCNAAGCYSHLPQYTLEMNKIVKVIDHSDRCQQFIKYRCQASVLLYYPRAAYGFWLSRDGEKMKYWGGGSSKRTGFCACGETGTCFNKSKRCNCDMNNTTMTSDEGYLTDKSKLPVSQMRFGDTDDGNEHGWHTLGKLECMG